jgi:adenylate cyclase
MEPILIHDVRTDDRFQGSESMKISGLRSAMCAPLLAAGDWDARGGHFSGPHRLFGILYVDNMDHTSAFTQEELNVFAVVAAQAAAAIDNARAHERLAEAAAQRHALERFLAPEVVEMIAAHPGEIQLGGINLVVTILFVDIRGFTAIAERMQPEKIVELLNEFFTRVTDVIFDHGGTLDKYLGDGVLAVFGTPISKGNDALRAVRAAVAIQHLLLELNLDAVARGRPEVKVGIGVNTGVVTAGNIGSPRRIEYTVVGDAVNVAARLMAHAAPAQILTTEATVKELGGEFGVTALPPLWVKGKSEQLRVFAVNWTQPSGKLAAP